MTRLIPEHFRGDGQAKRAYDDEATARAVAIEQQNASGSKRRPYHAYRCGFCDRWHVGRKPPRGKRNRPQANGEVT